MLQRVKYGVPLTRENVEIEVSGALCRLGEPMGLDSVLRFVKKVIPLPLKRALWTVLSPDPSQSGEGTRLRKLVAEFVCEKFIVDVGANDGVAISNSLPFVDAGWRAILIEPAPAVFKKLTENHAHRKNVTCLQIACSDKTGKADLYLGSDGEEGFLSTLCQTNNEWFSKARSSQTVKVKTDTLTNILNEQQAPNRPGILLVDCEGMDYEALLGLDFSRFRPTVVVTEEYELEPEKHASKYALLIRNNYSLVQKIGCNTIWVDRSAQKR